jgi:hypothetical protein
VLVSNLGGSTGALLSLDKSGLPGKLHLDVLYPVNGFKRCLDGQNGFGETFDTHLNIYRIKNRII